MKGILMMIGVLLTAVTAAAQETDTTGVEPQKTKTEALMEKVQMVKNYLDSTAMAKVDPLYIEVPKKPWRVILRQKNNTVVVDYDCEKEVGNWGLNFQPPLAKSVGFWVGYRGTGISYSYSLSKNAGRYFSFSSTGASYGFNFRYRRFNIKHATFHATVDEPGEEQKEVSFSDDLDSPVWIRSTYINGYYVFNGKRYSQAAAYNQSVIQRHSAGSLLLGATWYQSSFDYDDIRNFVFVMIGNNVGRIKVHQADIGLGYGYNWVPLRGLVVNGMVMPQLSVYERVKTYQYGFNYKNEQIKELIEQEKKLPDDIEGWVSGTETDYSALHMNFDLRLGIAYNWSDYFVGLQLQMNNFNYGKNNLKVNIMDAWGRLSAGVRF